MIKRRHKTTDEEEWDKEKDRISQMIKSKDDFEEDKEIEEQGTKFRPAIKISEEKTETEKWLKKTNLKRIKLQHINLLKSRRNRLILQKNTNKVFPMRY